MGKTKLNYRFHNPNTAETTADYILKVFIEANFGKVERAIRQAAEEDSAEAAPCELNSAMGALN